MGGLFSGSQFVVRVDGIKKLNKKFKDLTDYVRFRVPHLTENSAEFGVNYAASIAPRSTFQARNDVQQSGMLIQRIKHFKGKKKAYWEVVSRQPRGRRNRPYHLWMHNIGKHHISNRIRNGEPKYMFKTFEMLKRKYPKDISQGLRKTINK